MHRTRPVLSRAALAAKAIRTGIPYGGLIAPSWAEVLKPEFEKPYWHNLMDFLRQEKKRNQTVYPPADRVYSWSDACPLEDVKVVIVGQDPYHGGQAHGLSFSVRREVSLPPTLRNMYRELSTDVPGFVPPEHGCLQSWSDQGVLLLNSVLTVRAKAANSHKNRGWEEFTDAVIRAVDQHCPNVVFMLWGNYAKTKGAKINKQNRQHLILSGKHPSPLENPAKNGFFGCKHFSKANEFLVENGRQPIDWNSIMYV
eukprot:m.382334 g.382334  ORF g.382334 m.382334 type:complete len:255 (-) comp16718_c0_seq66:580-1344(-)